MRKRGRLKAGRRSPEMAITGGAQSWRSPWLLVPLTITVAVLLLVFASPESPSSEGSSDPSVPGPQGPGRVYHDIGIPLSDLGTEARWYTYDSDGTDVRFFAVLEPDGSPHVALDACDICYSRNLGFHQEGDVVQCNSCGKTFKVSGIGTDNVPNSCWPGYVPYELSEGYLLIDTELLDTMSYMFE